MSASAGYQWRGDKDGLGVWEHRGKVAVAGVGHSPGGRRWGGVSMDQTLGAYSILACQTAIVISRGAVVAPRRSGRLGLTLIHLMIRSWGLLWSTRSGSSRRWG